MPAQDEGPEMPKQKTNKAAAKRFKRTGSGKVKYRKAGSGHLLSVKTRKRKRGLRSPGVLSAVEAKRIQNMIG
jgi:large subunit ribosomal protein L35